MLGLMRGRRAGETKAEGVPLMLARFVPPLPDLLPALLLSNAPGVDAVIGEAAIDGLGAADIGKAVRGVPEAANLGVLRAASRGVPPVEVNVDLLVSIRSSLACWPGSSAAAAGSSISANSMSSSMSTD
jgi:hypothetical protein